MKIIVCVKQVVDPLLRVAVDLDTHQLPDHLDYCVNPVDLNAVEEALRLKERQGAEVILVSAGPTRVDEALRSAWGMGADRAVRVSHPALESSGGYATALVLGSAIRTMAPDMVICGNRSLDEGTGQVPPMLAEVLRLPLVTDATHMELSPARVIAQRKLYKGQRQVVESPLPVVISVDPSINQPRYASYRSIRRAQKEPILQLDGEALGLHPFECSVQRVKLSPPRPRPKKNLAVDISLAPEERAKQILLGGLADKKGVRWEGPAEHLADRLAQYLIERGFLAHGLR